MRIPKSPGGFTILETLIVVAIAGIAMAGVTAMIELISTGTAEQKFVYNSHDMTEEIRTTLGDPAACANTFQGLVPANIPAAMPAKLAFAGPVLDVTGKKAVYQVGASYYGALKVRDMYLTNLMSAPPGSGTFSLVMDFDAVTKVQGATSVLSITNISYTTDGSGNLLSCVAMARATDGLWKITQFTNTNIYYAGGNVGIGIPSAQYPLQVAQASGATQVDAANFSATGGYATVGVNNVSAGVSQRSALVFEKNGAGLFEAGTDFASAGSQNFYVRDNKAAQVRMLVDPSGNLGVGTAQPTTNLHVASAGSTAGMLLQTTKGGLANLYTDDGAKTHFETNNAVAVNMHSKQFLSLNAGGGSIGIGTTASYSPLTVYCPLGSCMTAQIPNNATGTWFSLFTDAVPRLSINYEMMKNTYRAVVVRNRQPQVPGSDKWWMVYAVGGQGYGPDDSIQLFGGTQQTGGEQLNLGNGSINVENGVVWAGGTCVSGPCMSDARLKENVRPFAPGLEALLQMNPVYYRFNGLGGTKKSDRDFIGVLAQDVEKAAPEIVKPKLAKLRPEDAVETELKRVEYGALIYVAINGIKDLYRMLTGLRDEIAALKKQNETLRRYVCAKDPAAPVCL